jgi:hypothetical protein
MTGISLHMQWPLTSQLHGSVSQREQLFFRYGSNSTPTYLKNVSITERPGLGQAELELGASTQLHF